MKKHFFVALLTLSIIGVFLGIIFNIKWFDYIFKPLIMISIAGHFVLHSKLIKKNIVLLGLFAFLFSFFGDIFMMLTEKGMLFFMLGLFSFLVAQLIYGYLFFQSVKIENREGFLKRKYFFLIIYIIYGGIIFSLILPQLNLGLKIAIFIYMFAISTMSALALNRYRVVSYVSFVLVFIGSVLFIISDTLIAFDTFYHSIPFHRLYTMSSYIAAQYLIMTGILKQFNSGI